MNGHRRQGPPQTGPARELIESGFAIENEDAPFLHAGLNLADLAHVLDLRRRAILPEDAARALLALLLEVHQMPVEDFPYDPTYGEPYNSREHYFVVPAGQRRRLDARRSPAAGGRPDRDAPAPAPPAAGPGRRGRRVRRDGHRPGRGAPRHRDARPDLPAAGPALDAGALPALVRLPGAARRRPDARRAGLGQRQPGRGRLRQRHPAAGRPLVRRRLCSASTRSSSTPATRCGRSTGSSTSWPPAPACCPTSAKLGEDLEIWSSSEFDFVDLADSYSRASVLMPNKRNPYSLSIVRGASGVLIGRLTGFLAVTKSPSARSDNLIFAYGEVPRALDLCTKITALITGVVDTLRVNARPAARGGARRLHPGHRPGRAPGAHRRGRLPHRLRRGRRGGARREPARHPRRGDHRRDDRAGRARAHRPDAGASPTPTWPRCSTPGRSCSRVRRRAAPHPPARQT